MQRRTSIYLSFLTLIGLCYPLFHELSGLVYVRPLSGKILPDSVKADNSWWTGGLQKKLELYATDSMRLRPVCIRIRNQLEFSLSAKVNAQDIYYRNGIFYRFPYVNYSEATDFVGHEKIKAQVKALKDLQKKTQKPVYVIIAPSKLHYYEEHLPDLNRYKGPNSNYLVYKKTLQDQGIALIDADSWFLKLKNKQHKPPLMARGGVHWTLYGGALALDSLLKRCSRDQHVDFQRVVMQIDPGDKVYPEDDDVQKMCNLFFPPVEKELKLIQFPVVSEPKRRLRPLVISDSYFHVISWTDIHAQVLDEQTAFYYYFATRFDRQNPQGATVDTEQLKTDLEKSDCILIISDILNLYRFGYGFIETDLSP